jgi:predicted HicB family RNase H-like nuclease
MLNHKGYVGVINFDDEANIFHGEVINTRDVITFQGTCVEDIRSAFVDSVEDYLEFCAERGEAPENHSLASWYCAWIQKSMSRYIYKQRRLG